MIRNCLFFLTGLLCLAATEPKKYHAEIKSADQFLSAHQQDINDITIRFHSPKSEVMAIVYPELLRYNLFRDFLETALLEELYVKGGVSIADFSIGPFQMKPSFVEDLEFHIEHIPALQNEFGFIATYQSLNENHIRNERLKRLKSFEWQIYYAYCYYAIAQDCYAGLTFKNKSDQIAFFATAYNFGFNRAIDDINSWITVKAFPYGKKVPMDQLSYHSLSLHYFHRCIP